MRTLNAENVTAITAILFGWLLEKLVSGNSQIIHRILSQVLLTRFLMYRNRKGLARQFAKALRPAFSDFGEVCPFFGFPRRRVTSGDGTRAVVCQIAECFGRLLYDAARGIDDRFCDDCGRRSVTAGSFAAGCTMGIWRST
jgi:hypothetical protein